jgi:hypothetical protein
MYGVYVVFISEIAIPEWLGRHSKALARGDREGLKWLAPPRNRLSAVFTPKNNPLPGARPGRGQYFHGVRVAKAPIRSLQKDRDTLFRYAVPPQFSCN